MGPNTKKGPHDLQKKSTKECQIEDRNQQLHVPAAQCMVAILPFVKIGMAQKDRGYLDTVARKKGVVGGIAKLFTQGGCTSDAECLTKQGSMCHNQHGSMWTGLSARASCDFQKGSLKGPRTNVCVCGIFADHVKTKEECNGKNMPSKCLRDASVLDATHSVLTPSVLFSRAYQYHDRAGAYGSVQP